VQPLPFRRLRIARSRFLFIPKTSSEKRPTYLESCKSVTRTLRNQLSSKRASILDNLRFLYVPGEKFGEAGETRTRSPAEWS
jgi:hypothetical protein